MLSDFFVLLDFFKKNLGINHFHPASLAIMQPAINFLYIKNKYRLCLSHNNKLNPAQLVRDEILGL